MNYDFPCPHKQRKIMFTAISLDNTNFESRKNSVSLLSSTCTRTLNSYLLVIV